VANRSAAKGSLFENSLLPLLREYYGPDVIRRGKQGVKDCGDYLLPGERRFALEAKNESSYAGKLSGWLGEADREAANLGVPHGVVVHKRRGSTDPAHQYVTCDLLAFLELVKR
jgi:hypothetical protein